MPAALSLSGCSDGDASGSSASSPAPGATARTVIAVSVLPQRALVQRIAGEDVRVEVMLPPGASPTSFEPSFTQLRAIEAASLYVQVGHPHFAFEAGWLDRLLAARPGLVVVGGGDCEDAAPGGEDEGDPHRWLSPACALATASAVADALATLRPAEAAAIRSRLAALRREIEALDQELRSTLAPVRGGRFLVFHPAWGYFARRYGLTQVAIERDNKAPGLRELAQLTERAHAEGFRHVIVQPQMDATAARSLAREIGARVIELDPLAPDWADNLRRAARVLSEAAVLPRDAAVLPGAGEAKAGAHTPGDAALAQGTV